MAHAHAHERDGSEQAGGDHQREQGPCGRAAHLDQRAEHGQLAHEAGERWQARDDHGAQGEGHAQEGKRGGNGAADQLFFVVVEVDATRRFGVQEGGQCVVAIVQVVRPLLRLARALQQFHQQVQRAARQRGAGQVEQRPAAERGRVETDGGDQRAGRRDDAVAREPVELLRGQHADGAKGQRGQAAPDQRRAAEAGRTARLRRKAQRPQAQDGVDPHFGEDGEDGGCGRAGRAIGGWKPEVERPQRGLGQEGDGQDGRAGVQQAAVAFGHQEQLVRDVGHVERARDAIQQSHADEEQQRGEQVDGDVVQARAHARDAAAVQQQAVAGGQQHLEEHEEIEQVAGEEGAVQAHELQLEQHVEVHARVLPARQRVEQRGQAHRARQHRHEGGQRVGHQHDAVRHRPVARQVDAEGRGATGLHAHQQQDRQCQPQRGGGGVDDGLGAAAAFAQHEHERGGAERQQHRRHQQVFDRGKRGESRHERSSSPSTWSPPDKPRSASSTTRNSAVVAKPMTMAVSTSDCGSGSV